MKAYPDVEITVNVTGVICSLIVADTSKRPDTHTKYPTNMNGVRAPPSRFRIIRHSHRIGCTICSKMYAYNLCSLAGLTRPSADTVDTASRLIQTNVVRRSPDSIALQLLTRIPYSVRSLQDRKTCAVIRNAHASESQE